MTQLYIHTHIYIYVYTLFHVSFHYGSPQNIEYSSLCSTVWPCCLSLYFIFLPFYLNMMHVHLELASPFFFFSSKSSSFSKSSMTWLLNQSFRAFCFLNLQLDCFDTVVKGSAVNGAQFPGMLQGGPLCIALRRSKWRWGSWWKHWAIRRSKQVLGN